MTNKSDIERELSKIRAERKYRLRNWGGQGHKDEAELRGFQRALEWVLEGDNPDTHPPSGWLTLRRGRDDE